MGTQAEACLALAPANRDIIGVAGGIVVQRHDPDAVGAFRTPVEPSRFTKTKLHQASTWLVEHHREL